MWYQCGYVLKKRRQSLQLSFAIESISIFQKSINVSAQVHNSIISGSIHDQKESHLCWAFSTATVIRAELKRLVKILHQNGVLTAQEEDHILKEIDQMNKENRLMYEIVCLITPRSPKLENFFGNRASFQPSSADKGLGRLSYDGIIRPPGWTRIPSIRRITNTLLNNQMIDQIEFKPEFFKHPMSGLPGACQSIDNALRNFVDQEGKPTIGIIFGGQPIPNQASAGHAVTLVKEENNNYIFKNSYGANNPNNPEYIPTYRIPKDQRNDFYRFSK